MLLFSCLHLLLLGFLRLLRIFWFLGLLGLLRLFRTLSSPSGFFSSSSDSAIPTKNVLEDMHTFQLSKVSLQLRVSQSVSDVRGYFCTSQPYKLQGNVCLKALQSLKITNFADGFFQIKLISFAIGLKTQTKLN